MHVVRAWRLGIRRVFSNNKTSMFHGLSVCDIRFGHLHLFCSSDNLCKGVIFDICLVIFLKE